MLNRKFSPGTEWIYFKIYSGIKTCDIILHEVISPLVSYLKEEHLSVQWFFIRYHDPKHHIRLRFLLKSKNDFSLVLEKFNQFISPFGESGELSHFMLDTYIREIERYGESTIELAEELFCTSSELALDTLNFCDENKMLVCILYIETVLSLINLTDKQKLEWISQYDTSTKKEFNGDKNLNKQLDKKFRIFRLEYLKFTQADDFREMRNTMIFKISEKKDTLLQVLERINDGNIPISSVSFYQSIFHIHINRMFTSNQRVFEMIIYDHIHRLCNHLLNKENRSK